MYSIGVDIGGTNVRVALLDSKYNIIKKMQSKTGKREFTDVIEDIVKMIKEIDPNNEVEFVGICSPGPIDKIEGMILDAPNLPTWRYKPFVRRISEAVNKKVYLTNDANAAAMAQAIDDDNETIVFITTSTGIGGGIVYKGKLIEGKKVYAGEFGMMIISDEKREESSLYAGSLESLCSGTALAFEASRKYGEDIDAKELFNRYERKDAIALEIIDKWAEYYSRALANLLQIIEPDVFYLGGSVITNNQYLLEILRDATKNKVYQGLRDRINLVVAKYGDDAGIVGAAYNGFISFKEEVL
ncbi:MAG: ROK family protein [Tissierellia bacterium]|nr:ROK family protein [Tissierellia bacterium]